MRRELLFESEGVSGALRTSRLLDLTEDLVSLLGTHILSLNVNPMLKLFEVPWIRALVMALWVMVDLSLVELIKVNIRCVSLKNLTVCFSPDFLNNIEFV